MRNQRLSDNNPKTYKDDRNSKRRAHYWANRSQMLQRRALYRETETYKQTRQTEEYKRDRRNYVRRIRAANPVIRSAYNEASRKSRAKYRLIVMKHYSPELVCACCGESEYEFLTIDHVNGGGIKHRKEMGGGSGVDWHKWLKRNNFPDGFQILCMNCNLAKGKLGECPHVDKSDVS